MIFKKDVMSIQLLRDKVYEKCEKKLAEFDEIKDAPMARIHKEIRKGFALELNNIINSFVSELSKCLSDDEKIKVVSNFKEKFSSKQFKEIFKKDMYYSGEYKRKCIKNCDITDARTTKGFLFNNETKDEKSYDFYCVFIGKLGWNGWVEEVSPADFIISVEHNNTDKSIVHRYEIRNLPKNLNSIPFIEIENYVPRLSILEEILNLFKQKNRKINITGISGIGKTFLAKHFVKHYSENYSHIIWLYCSKGLINAVTSDKGIELLDNLGLINEFKAYCEGTFEAKSLVSLVINRLRKIEGNNLLILDNINESIYDFEEELSLSLNWNLLTTSLEKLDEFYSYQIPAFNKDASLLFYKFYSLEKDDVNLNRLLSTIDYHTLTIELVAKTAQQRKISIVSIVNRFIKRGLNIVDKTKLITKHSKEKKLIVENIENYLEVIFDTSNLSINELKILLNIALLQSEIVSKDLFSEIYLNGNKEIKDIEVLEADLEILYNKGWLTENLDNLSIHNLIKSILIKKLRNNHLLIKDNLLYLAKRLEVFVLEDFENSINYFKLAENIIDNTKGVEEKDEFKIIVKPLSEFYNHIGLNIMSFDIFSKYFTISEENNITWELIEKHNDFATKLFLIENHKGAISFAEFVYEIFTESEDPYINIRFAIENFNELCKTEFSKQNLEKDEKMELFFQRIFKNISIFLNSARILGVLYAKKGDIEKGKKIISDCIDDYELLISGLLISINEDENNSIVPILKFEECQNKWVTTVHDFADIFLLNKESDIAIHYFNEVLRIINELKKPPKANLYRIYNDLALFYMNNGNMDKAWNFIVEFIKIADKIPENSSVRFDIDNLINKFEHLISQENDSEIQKEILDKLNDSIENAFSLLHQEGNNSTNLISYYEILSMIHFNSKFYNEAILYKKKGLQILKNLNESEIEIANSLNFIAGCYLGLEKYEDGLIYIDESIQILNNNTQEAKDILENALKIKNALLILSNEFETIKLEILKKTEFLVSSIIDLKSVNFEKFIDSILNHKSSNKEVLLAFLDLYISNNVTPNYDILILIHHISAEICFSCSLYEKAIYFKLRQLVFINFFASKQIFVQIADVHGHLAVYYCAIPIYEKANESIAQAISVYRLVIEINNQEIEIEVLKSNLERLIIIQEFIQGELKKFRIK